MTKHYSPARRDNYRDAEGRRKLRDSQRKQARALKVRAREGSK
jgi:hypothetical protein